MNDRTISRAQFWTTMLVFCLLAVTTGCSTSSSRNAPTTGEIVIGATEIKFRKPGETKTQVFDLTPISKSVEGTIQEIDYEPGGYMYMVVAADDGELYPISCGAGTEIITPSGTHRGWPDLQVGQRVKVDYEITSSLPIVAGLPTGEVTKEQIAKKIVIISSKEKKWWKFWKKD